MHERPLPTKRRRSAARLATVLLGLTISAALAGPAQAAKSAGCVGAGYRLVNTTSGAVIASGTTDRSIPAASFGTQFAVRGQFNEFNVRSSDFAVLDYAFTGARQQRGHDRWAAHSGVRLARFPTTAGSR